MKTRTENLAPVTDGRWTLNKHSMAPLARILDSAAHCTSRDETRPALNAVFIEVTADEWTATATDSYLLATMTTVTNPVATDAPNSLHNTGSVMIPRTVAAQWIKTLQARTTTYATIEVTAHEITLRTNETTHTTARPVAEFPNFRNLIPELHTYTEEEKATPTGYHPARLAQIATSAAKLAPKLDLRLTIEASHPTKPTRMACTVQDVAQWTGLLMPMRNPG
jgi:hypothetical protein